MRDEIIECNSRSMRSALNLTQKPPKGMELKIFEKRTSNNEYLDQIFLMLILRFAESPLGRLF